MSSKVNVLTSRAVKSIVGEDGIVNEVVLAQKDGTEEAMKVDQVIVNYGNISSLGAIKEWGLEMDRNSIVVNSRMETNIEGIYAAGDVTSYDGKVKLIAVGLGEAPTAVNHAKAFIDPKAKLQPFIVLVSSTKKTGVCRFFYYNKNVMVIMMSNGPKTIKYPIGFPKFSVQPTPNLFSTKMEGSFLFT